MFITSHSMATALLLILLPKFLLKMQDLKIVTSFITVFLLTLFAITLSIAFVLNDIIFSEQFC